MLRDMPASTVDLSGMVREHASGNFSPSGLVAVYQPGGAVEWEAWGRDGYEPRTPFRIASCTKSFTALALLVLRRAGALNLDDEACKHLPELTTEAPAGWPSLRLRHLLSMSGGLATDNPWGDRQEASSREQLAAWARGLRLIFPPGGGYEYSNLGYALLGEVITRVSGKGYTEFVREQILEPLGLSATAFAAGGLHGVAPSYHREPMLPGQPGGWTPQAQSGPGAFSPIGGLYASAQDLARWAGLFLERRVPEGVGFTAADLLEAQQPLNIIGAGPAEAPLHGVVANGYGYGLKVERYAEHGTLVSHAGGYPGFTAYMCWHQETGHVVVASSNGTHSAAPQLARKVMFELMAEAKPAPKRKEPWPETLAAVAAVDDLVRAACQEDPEALALRDAGAFAGNVELDFPIARRVAYLHQALVNLGALGAAEPPEFEQPCRARWRVPAENGRLELFVEMTPVAPYLVQTFSAVAVNGGAKLTLF